MISPKDKIIVRLESKYNDKIQTESGITLYQDTSYRPEWHTTVQGTVVSVPPKVSKDDPFNSRIELEVQPGDTLFFSYMVVFDREYPAQKEYFFDISDGTPFKMEFTNCLDEKIVVQKLGDIHAGVIADKYGNVLDGLTGTQREVDRWLSRFKFCDDSMMVHANNLEDDLWLVDYKWAIAVKRNGEMKMIGSYVLMEPLHGTIEHFDAAKKLIVPEYLKNTQKKGYGKVVCIGSPLKGQPKLSIKPGDEVLYDERYVEQYKFENKDYLLIKQHRIQGCQI
jgi:co-chaperonin GroES (HSP10)